VGLLLALSLVLVAVPGFAAVVQIDLDRSTAGIQATLNVPANPSSIDVLGAVVVTGTANENVGANVTQVLVTDIIGGGATIDPANSTLTNGDMPPGFIAASGVVNANDFVWTNALPPTTNLGDDGVLVLVNFNLRIINLDTKMAGDTFRFDFATSAGNPALGITLNGANGSFGAGGENPPVSTTSADIVIGGAGEPTPTNTEIVVEPTPTNTEIVVVPTPTNTEIVVEPTPTNTEIPVEPTATNTEAEPTPTATEPKACQDSGYYVLTSYGQHIRVGNPALVTGNVSSAQPVFVDMELGMSISSPSKNGLPVVDLLVLDKSGTATFIENPGSTPAQAFLFDASSTCGYAVDVEISADSLAFWVLTEGGGIFRVGSANPGTPQLGNDAADLCNLLPIPFGDLRDPNFAKPGDGASIRAVALAVVENLPAKGITPAGYIVMDSQGGTYLFDGDGVSIRNAANVAGSATNGVGILDRNTVYPFFPGLDIARDMELAPAGTATDGLAIYDGWGGVHPVPVDQETDVRFLRNETAVGSGVLLTTVGLPYLITAFDNPETVADESQSALDVNSIFVDIEFCSDGRTDGAYVMDKFGGVFAFGSTRNTPDNTSPRFTGSPYFFPNLYAVDMEPILTPESIPTNGE
jgi:hypothetical protein